MRFFLFSFFFSFIIISFACKNEGNNQTDLEKRLESLRNPASHYILTAAHRALHTKYPENSLSAIRHSIETGIDMIEIDVRQTSDGVLVLMHDASVERTTDGQGRVNELTYNEIKNLHLKSSPEDSDIHPVPALKEVLTLVKNKILVDIDIKAAPVGKLVQAVNQTGTIDQVLFFQHHNVTHDSMRAVDRNLMIVPRAETAADVRDFLNHLKPVTVQIPPEIASSSLISEMQKSGCKPWINALGAADDLAENGQIEAAFSPLVKMGATIIQSDRPDLLLQYLRQIDRHW